MRRRTAADRSLGGISVGDDISAFDQIHGIALAEGLVMRVRALEGVSVLVVDDDPDTLGLMFLGLGAVGAETRSAGSAEEALTILETWQPDVILSDIKLPGADGFQFLEKLRADPRLSSIPAAALSGSMSASRTGTFEKYLAKPSRLPEIVLTLATLASQGRTPSSPATTPAQPSEALRGALTQLGTVSECRYTSLQRFDDDGSLRNVWTFDHDLPLDVFPAGIPEHAAFGLLVRDAAMTVVVEDATTDPRVANRPGQHAIGRYIGAPLIRSDGAMFGVVCCYDATPRAIRADTRAALEAAARTIEPWLDGLFAITG